MHVFECSFQQSSCGQLFVWSWGCWNQHVKHFWWGLRVAPNSLANLGLAPLVYATSLTATEEMLASVTLWN